MAAAHRSVRRVARTVGAGILTALLTTGSVSAQDLEPRAYSPSPVGTTFLVVTATRSTGGVLTDPSIPLTDVGAQLELGGVGVGHSFALLGKSALVLGAVPITWATVRGEVGENQHEASRRGLADPRVKLSMILAGSRPMTPAEFARAPRRPIVGASLTVAPPLVGGRERDLVYGWPFERRRRARIRCLQQHPLRRDAGCPVRVAPVDQGSVQQRGRDPGRSGLPDRHSGVATVLLTVPARWCRGPAQARAKGSTGPRRSGL